MPYSELDLVLLLSWYAGQQAIHRIPSPTSSMQGEAGFVYYQPLGLRLPLQGSLVRVTTRRRQSL